MEAVLALLPKEQKFFFPRAHFPRALPENIWNEKAAAFGLEGNDYPNVNTALHSALEKASKNDLILICGSVFVVGEVAVHT